MSTFASPEPPRVEVSTCGSWGSPPDLVCGIVTPLWRHPVSWMRVTIAGVAAAFRTAEMPGGTFFHCARRAHLG